MIEYPMLSYKHCPEPTLTTFMKSTPNVVKSVIRNFLSSCHEFGGNCLRVWHALIDIRNFLMVINGRNGKRQMVTIHC